MRKPHCTEQALLKRRDVIKGGAVVLASAFFPFSIEILNAGSAVAAPPAVAQTASAHQRSVDVGEQKRYGNVILSTDAPKRMARRDTDVIPHKFLRLWQKKVLQS